MTEAGARAPAFFRCPTPMPSPVASAARGAARRARRFEVGGDARLGHPCAMQASNPRGRAQAPPANVGTMEAPAHGARLPAGKLEREVGTGLLVLAALVAGTSAYLFLSVPGGFLPRPAGVSALPLVAAIDRAVPVAAGVALLVVFVVVTVTMWLRQRRLMRYLILLRSFEANPDGRAIIGADGRVVYHNSAFARMMGSDLGARFAQLESATEGEDGGRQLMLLREVAAAGGTGHAEICVAGESGGRQWLKLSAYRIARRRGYVLWCVEDVTARREIEKILEEERAKLEDFLESASVGFYSVDSGGRFDYVNYTLALWLGLPVWEFVRSERRLADFLAVPGDPGRPWNPFPKGHAGERGEVTFRRADGSEFQAEIIQTFTGDAADGTLVARSVVRDLTAEREMQETLDTSEQRFRKLFEEGPTGIAILGLDGEIAECNRAFRELAARGRDVTGSAIGQLIAPENREALSALLAELAEGERPQSSLDVRFAENPEGSASLSITRLEDAAGNLSGLILHLFDTTQHRRLEAQFVQSQKMQAVGQLAGGIAHDFNNLLTVMIGFCDLILQRHRPGEQTFADIMQIKQNANRAANLVRQLLAFSRQQTMQPKVLNITDVLAELSHLLRRLIGVNIALHVVHGRDLGLVRVDQVQFEQVIINLVVNARDAMKEKGGTLTIRTSNATVERRRRRGDDAIPPGRYVKIEITDTGVGIPPENLERIFEPFFSTKEVGAGTGLGLATVYGIVTQTGGFVQVKSKPGEGTTFSIFLPRHEAAAAAGVEEARAGPLAAKDLSGVGTVLLVEDEDPVRLFGARALRNKGYTVLEAKSGDAALEVMQRAPAPIDLVISDVVMPQRDGLSLVREVRERYPGMKVIFISGYAEDEFRDVLERQPGIHFLAKPFSLEQLAGKVKEVLAG